MVYMVEQACAEERLMEYRHLKVATWLIASLVISTSTFAQNEESSARCSSIT